MRKFLQSDLIATGLAVFSMLFGAGNLMYPLNVGMLAGDKNIVAIIGFMLTGICLPLLGLVALILFDGDYKVFFKRLGNIPGACAIFLCMLIIGPFFAMPRIVTLSHIIMTPYIWHLPLWLFSGLFCLLTFLGCYKEQGIINLLGAFVSPALLISLSIIIIKGIFFTTNTASHVDASALTLFWQSIKEGYLTLDLLGTIFFSSIVITILKKNLQAEDKQSLHRLAIMGLKAGTLGVALLALVYFFMSYLGVLHGTGLETIDHGSLFSAISLRVLGIKGGIIIAIAVFMACYSTIIALAAVLSEYVSTTLTRGKMSYVTALAIVLSITALVSNTGLGNITQFAKPIIEIGYPVIIVITVCNILYKLFGFKPIKLPVLITLIVSSILYFW